MMVRLHKHLAACGVGSRRQCEQYMAEGRVTVDGAVARQPGTQVDPQKQEILFNGRPVQKEKSVYILLHKPPGHVCTSHDPQGRPCAVDLVPEELGRIYTVGRLDADSEGMIVLTNDGEFAHRLSHPKHEIAKVYEMWLDRPLTDADKQAWLAGVESDGETLAVMKISDLPAGKAGCGYRVVLGEGRNRHLRRMASASGKRKVLRLKRVEIGGLKLGDLKRSAWRYLTDNDLRALSKSETRERGKTGKKKASVQSRTVDMTNIPG